jgi:hypothetical protein
MVVFSGAGTGARGGLRWSKSICTLHSRQGKVPISTQRRPMYQVSSYSRYVVCSILERFQSPSASITAILSNPWLCEDCERRCCSLSIRSPTSCRIPETPRSRLYLLQIERANVSRQRIWPLNAVFVQCLLKGAGSTGASDVRAVWLAHPLRNV